MVFSYQFYGLLFVSEQDFFYNLKDRGSDAVDRFAEMASLCAQSAAYCGHDFALITNNRADLELRFAKLGLKAPALIEEQFDETSLPKSADYFSAHHKLDVLKKFASGKYGDYPCLIDIDTVFIKPLHLETFGKKPLVIDMSYKMIDDDARPEIEHVMSMLTGESCRDPSWYGGEFIAGTPEFFEKLSERIAEYWPRYVENLRRIFHNGDETILSAALNILRRQHHLECVEIGALEVGTRWESCRTTKIQMSHRDAFRHHWLHLPSDKSFLAQQAHRRFSVDDFFHAHRRYYFVRKLFRNAYSLVENPLRGRTLYMSQMG